jgi:hypothetical protein
MAVSEDSHDQRDSIGELINRRRRQVIVHSVLYYRLDAQLIPDATFDSWARELSTLQEQNPEIAEEVPYMREAFHGFTGDTGFDLPLDDPAARAMAQRLLAHPKAHSA